LHGVTFRAENDHTLVMKNGTCESKATWDFKVCQGCACAKGLVSVQMQHDLTKDSNVNHACFQWFSRMDQAIRTYITSVRAQFLVIKLVKCLVEHKSSAHLSTTTSSTSLPSRASVPAGWVDKTADVAQKMNSHCKTAISMSSSVLARMQIKEVRVPFKFCKRRKDNPCNTDGEFEDGEELIPWARRKELANMAFGKQRVSCSDEDYPTNARLAWTPLAGARYMPPTVVSQGDKLKISCGNPAHKTNLVSLSTFHNVYAKSQPEWYGKVWGMEAPLLSTCCPPRDILSNGKYNGMFYHGKPVPWNTKHPLGGYIPKDEHQRRMDSLGVCFRDEFGSASGLQCDSEFDFKVHECKGCDCTNAKTGECELVRVESQHHLTTNATEGMTRVCQPWFVYVDTMVRNQLAALRADLVDKKMKQCDGQCKGGTVSTSGGTGRL